ncbi:hypothetical protein F441_15451 [Phytophthora nicotianae CJ01A1]|uniref:Uncharacterized protein n=1 Tax=Phytophthora nicotianae CJ01A1 TaxID=1317063 RepID=W2WD44_PHYNI|nr:hypothetical protein F441_15451 [Phytophthora nicotianae CJ01A1]
MDQPVKKSEFGVKLVGHVHVEPSAETLRKCIESGKVKSIIDTVYPFEKSARSLCETQISSCSGQIGDQSPPALTEGLHSWLTATEDYCLQLAVHPIG